MRIYIASLAALVFGAALGHAQPPALVLKAEQDRVAVVAKVKPTVVAIFARGGQGGGTGVLINEDGYALTNFHVVQPTGPTMQCGLADGVLYDGVLVGWDKVGDVALIKLLPKKEGQKFPYAALGNSDKVSVGDWSIAMGNPFLLATDFTPTVTFGLVSGVNRYQPPAGLFLEYTDCIQIDTSINPGNSGGPLFNMKGEVIGINGRGSFDKRARINSGVGYAISINQIKNFMGHLRAGLDADHASLGALVKTEAENNGLGKTRVTVILEESDAYRRGLDQEDQILTFAGRSITSDNHYKNILGIFPRGWRVPLEFQRGDGSTAVRKDVLVRLMGVQRKELPDDAPQPKEQPKIQLPKGGGAQGPAAKYYQPKEGFANYYFNKLEKDRLLDALKKQGHLGGAAGAWTIEGRVKLLKARADSPFSLKVFDEKEGASEKPKVVLKIGEFPEEMSPLPTGNFAENELRKPNLSGGLMPAMYVWRHFLTQGEKHFSECFHGGMEPFYPPPPEGKRWADQRKDAEILNSKFGPYQVKWFFSMADQKLLGFELRLKEFNEDPCEVFFSEHKVINGRQMPEKMEVYYQDKHYGTFDIKSYKLGN